MTHTAPAATPVRMFGRCAECKRRFVVQDVTLVERHGRKPGPDAESGARMDAVTEATPCVSAWGHMIVWAGLRATATGTECSAKCSDSATPTCKCACGGENHGTTA